MIEFLARRVYEGKLNFDDVPERFKQSVLEILESKYGSYQTAVTNDSD